MNARLAASAGALLALAAVAACGGSSGAGRSCFSDAECGGKLCVMGRCTEGVRAADGGHADGGPVADGGGALVDGGGPVADGGIAPDAGNGCQNDAQCGAPGNICVQTRCVPGCATTGCGAGLACSPTTGRCGGACNNDGECGAPASICDNSRQCVPGCGVVGCSLRNASCSAASGRCSSCASDAACNAPTTVCMEGGCVSGCATTGCPSGQTCGAATGRCATSQQTGSGTLGADCQRDADCTSGKCLELTVSSRPFKVCAKLCCGENDCPARDSGGNGVGCIEFFGANYCLTDRIFAGTGVKLERATGQACGPGASDNWCRSGLCRTESGQRSCQSVCCTDQDCGALTCAFRPGFSPGEIAHHACELNLTGGRQGEACSSELECATYMCIPIGAQPFCADTCCTSRDCPSSTVCVQLESGQTRYTNLGMACLPHPGGGSRGTGSACTSGAYPNECASGLCAAGTCAEPCCFDADCGSGRVCRGVDNGEQLDGQTRNGIVRICVPG